MSTAKPIFTVRLAGCGIERLKELHKFPRSVHDYVRIRENNILKLVMRVLDQLCMAFIKPERRGTFYYDLVCLLLSKLNGIDWAYLVPDMWTLPSRMGHWGLSRINRQSAKNKDVELVETYHPVVRRMPDVRTPRR